MIVKDEAHIVRETLENITKYINLDYYVICDTGSTDDTKEIIKNFFDSKNIKGEIYDDKWVDFAHNRTKAINYAYKKTDYLLIFDADDSFHGNFSLPENMDADAYDLQFPGYNRKLLISNHMRWKFKGVLHEILTNIDPIKKGEFIKGDYYIESGRTGNRNKNPNKYLDDAIILENAFNNTDTEPDLLPRYCFYCAQSYQCANGNEEKAIYYYKKTLELEIDNCHKYVCCYRLNEIFGPLNRFKDILFYANESIKYDKHRVEAILPEVEYYYTKGMHYKVNMIYNFFKDKQLYENTGKLFIIDENIMRFLHYSSVSAYYANDIDAGYYSSKELFLHSTHYTENCIGNFIFYVNSFKTDPNKKELINWFINYINDSKKPFAQKKRIYDEFLSFPEIKKDYDSKKIHNYIYPPLEKIEFDNNNNNILFYTGYAHFFWNDSSLKNKNVLGGSEKAIIYLSRHLPKEYNIYIAGDQNEETIDNIKYIPHDKLQILLDNTKFYSIIVSRYISFFYQFTNIRCHKLILMAHDACFVNNHITEIDHTGILSNMNRFVDNIICLTNWHKNNFHIIYPFLKNENKIITINNGINTSNFKFNYKTKIKNKFIWSSCAVRGLHTLLNLWENILNAFPDATLDICSYDPFPKTNDDIEMKKIIDKHDSISHHGKLPEEELYDLISKCEFWLYTTNFPETSCITAMEMLMSEVICLYYPIAGLNDTLGNYGIPVKQGEEIKELLNLTTEKKALMVEKGKEYALSCSWKNRAEEWSTMLGLNKKKKKIGIFNSFQFHYEMYGFILNYAQNNDILVDIFTNQHINMGWLDFYKDKFNNFDIIDYNKFDGNTEKYSIFFLATDDDFALKTEWKSNNVICLNHYYKIRNHNFKHYLNVANFKDSSLEYTYACYPLIDHQDKIQNTNVCIIGGGNGLHISIIERLHTNSKIKLNICARALRRLDISQLSTSKFDINFIEDIDTQDMIKLLKKSSYVLINYNDNEDHNSSRSCSGSLPLALSTLCKPIISQTCNKYFQIENALEFDMESDEPINIDDEIDFKAIEEERNKYVDKFDNYLTTSIFKNNVIALIVEPRKLNKLDKIIKNVYNKLNNNSIYNWEILFYCGKGLKTYYLSLFNDIEINIIELDTNNFTFMEYNDFFKSLSLWNNINSKYTLVFQADCYIFNNPPYSIDYFIDKNFSYIGGNMSYEWKELKYHNLNPEYRNFNGGLSLRKTKDMINIINSFKPEQSIEQLDKFETYGEDVYFTIGAYKLNLTVGDTKDDQYFSCHSIINDNCFGIHNSDIFLDKKHLLDIYPEIYNQSYIINPDKHTPFYNKFYEVYIKTIKPKIIDCFTFYNELEMLNYRLNILNDVVDYFVLVEATHTHVGKEKPLFYQDNKHLFEKFNHKIIHIIVDDFTHKFPNINIEKEEQWINERYQRDCISRGIDKLSLQNNDVITITDLDEIPNPKILEQIKNKEITIDINIIEMDFYYYNLHSKMDHLWHHSKILTFQKYNELNIGCDNIRFYNCPIIKNAGWHLSYFGNEKFIKNKLENFTHQEYNKIEFTDEKLIKERINNGNDLFDRPTSIINIPIEDNNNLPPYYDIYLKKFYNIHYKNIIFIHIPKTAGYAIGRCLRNCNFLKDGYGFSHNIARNIIKPNHINCVVLGVVRNPYDRLYSIFEFYKKKRDVIDKNESFENFILNFEEKYYLQEPEFNTCYDFLTDKLGNLMATDIIKFENLQTEYDDFCKKYNLINNLIKMNENNLKDTNIDWSKLYNNEMKIIVEKIFYKDFSVFNYSYSSFLNSKNIYTL
jgi:beta-1,4-mannosyl-glycoprotein beta-1,4-N-acetylglucosaminyltransferase